LVSCLQSVVLIGTLRVACSLSLLNAWAVCRF